MSGYGDWDFDVKATHKLNMFREDFDDSVRMIKGEKTLIFPTDWNHIAKMLGVVFDKNVSQTEWEFWSRKPKTRIMHNIYLGEITNSWDQLKIWHLVDNDGNFKTITAEGIVKFFAFRMMTS